MFIDSTKHRINVTSPRSFRFSWLTLLLPMLAGCITISGNTEYPPTWAPHPRLDLIGNCPVIAGSYSNDETDFANNIDNEKSWAPKVIGFDMFDLMYNLGVEASAKTIELKQPDGNTLVVGWHDEKGNLATQTLQLGKDFECDAKSLNLTSTSSRWTSMISAIDYVKHELTLSFTRASDGALIMAIKGGKSQFWGLAGINEQGTCCFVRWAPAKAIESSPASWK